MRALDCLLDYAAGHAAADGAMPGDVLRLVADVLAARGGDEAVAGAIGVQLPVLHRRATAFTAAHPELYALGPHARPPHGWTEAAPIRCCSPPWTAASSWPRSARTCAARPHASRSPSC
ncbi:hypothetical protein ABT033_38050 [Streptomyces pharetrae]|uniref:hypothetical protein n=1 Tax=Streptomyces pharetrae TaxID=291370 RepID=UPI0033624162